MLRFVTLFSLTALAVSAAGPDKIVPATNGVPVWQQVGQQPYEMTWKQREENPHTLVDFEDLSGWKLELWNGATGQLDRSREQQMWGQYVAKFVFLSSRAAGRVIARPATPIPIPGNFDSVDLWGYGNDFSYEHDATTPPADVSVLITDARGKEFSIPLTSIRWKQWWLIHSRLPASVRKDLVYPAVLSGIEISNIRNTEPRYFFCDSLAFYQEELNPLHFGSQPKRNLKPWPSQIQGLNTGEGRLPFPTREETILPLNFVRDYHVEVRQLARGHFVFAYRGRDAAITYDYRPRTGELSEITASVDHAAPFRPLDGGGVRFENTPDGAVFRGSLESATLAGDVVTARFREGAHVVEYKLRLWQKSLVLDVLSRDVDEAAVLSEPKTQVDEAEELSFGRVSGVSSPKLITVPYLTYGSTNPRVLMHGSSQRPLFTSVWFDWYRSNGSEPYYPQTPKVFADGAPINGGIRYIAKTDGHRNPLYERLFVTTSPAYDETLPSIPNPPSLRQKEGAGVVWTVAGEFDTFRGDHARCRKIRDLGLDHIMQHSHEITWRDAGESFTLRLKPAPQKGGADALFWYVHAQNALGWLQGVYTNYTDFATTNENWNPDWVQRDSTGEWRRAWMRCYALKPAKAVEFDQYYAQRIQQKFGTKMSYTDVHTAVPPWKYNDFDARVPGAGTMAATFYAYGQLLLNDQRVYGPTQSEGTYQWLYAGLESGSYGWVYTDVNLLTRPLDVVFHLWQIHPLQCDYGMGDTGYYLQKIDPEWQKSPKRRDYVDLFLATTIAYGNMGWLVNDFPDEPFHSEAMARSYYMMQQLQQQYAFVTPSRIEYADRQGKFLSSSQALSSGVLEDSRLHVVYSNGTEVFVNRAASGDWAVLDNHGAAVNLPAAGWLVFNSSTGFYEISANQQDHRIDYVSSRGFQFLDGRGRWTRQGNLAASGSVVLRRRENDMFELIDIYGNQKLAVRSPGKLSVTAYDSDGKSMGNVVATTSGGWQEIRTVSAARSYRCLVTSN